MEDEALMNISNLVDDWLSEFDVHSQSFSVNMIDRILESGCRLEASDIHLQPAEAGVDVRYRIDGVLQSAGMIPPALADHLITRLKVMGKLVTYRANIPQEGRLRLSESRSGLMDDDEEPRERDWEMRLSTFPTLHGERAVIRLFPEMGEFERLDDLGFPQDVNAGLRHMIEHTNGGIIFAGPAGSGKTTTAYACMREIVETSDSCRSVVSLEDPIERAIPGTAQSEITAASKIDLATGLRFMMRQDPEVIMVGEIRDKATAEACLQASLTGHLVFSTFHAGSAAQAIERLAELGIDPYLLRSGLLGILSQRLMRRLCDCAHRHRTADDPDGALGLPVQHYALPNGCEKCTGTGYRGRMVITEMISLERPAVGQAVLERAETARLEKLAIERGMVPAKKRAIEAVENGESSPSEFRRVFGIAEDPWEELDEI